MNQVFLVIAVLGLALVNFTKGMTSAVGWMITGAGVALMLGNKLIRGDGLDGLGMLELLAAIGLIGFGFYRMLAARDESSSGAAKTETLTLK